MVSDDFNNSGNVSNWELGRIFVREGKFDDAHRCFLAEVTLSDSANTLVYNDHGHLLNMMGRYDDAIVKFDSYLSSHPNYASSWFGKGISFIGLNRLDEALDCFDKALERDKNHADAWYYSAIIYANHFYHNYNIISAKECFKRYLDSRDTYINNPDYFEEPFDDLSLEDVHDYYESSCFFRLIAQLLENGNIDEFDNFLKDYGGLYSFDEEDSDKQSDIFRLFVGDISLVDRIDDFNSNNNIEDKFESAGYEEDLIDDLASRFGGLSIEDKKVLVELMDYFKGFRLSLTDINELIHENVLADVSLDSINEKKEYIANNQIEENNYKLARNIEKKVNSAWDKKIAENERLNGNVDDLNKIIAENERLNGNVDDLNKKIKLLYVLIIFILLVFALLFYYFI